MRILKNQSLVTVKKNVLGKIFEIKPKGSLTITDSQADEIATSLLTTYGFLKDITPRKSYPAPVGDAEIKRVVRTAIPKKEVKKYDYS